MSPLDDYSITYFPPAALTAPDPADRPSPPPGVTRIVTPEGVTLLASLEPPAALNGPADGATAATLVADLLRPGWDETAAPVRRPIIQNGVIFRGFEMGRRAEMTDEAAAPWQLRCLIPAAMSESFDWERASRAIDRFHATVHDHVAHV